MTDQEKQKWFNCWICRDKNTRDAKGECKDCKDLKHQYKPEIKRHEGDNNAST